MALSKLFISYPSLDSAKVDTIVSRLGSLSNDDGSTRYILWQDKTSIPGGQNWWFKIVDGITNCEVFVFIVSRAALDSIVCCAELSYAYKLNLPIIPVVLQGEHYFNKDKGKNDVTYWSDIPQELVDLNAQFLFYEGTSFYTQLEEALDEFERTPNKKSKPTRPPNPIDGKNDTQIYQEACDLASQLEFDRAERLFMKLANRSDSLFETHSREWLLVIGDYREITDVDGSDYTRYQAYKLWQEYKQKFPKEFITLFDPKNFQEQGFKPSSPLMVPMETSQTTYILPQPFAWIDIPAGNVLIEEGGDIREGGQTFEVEAFSVAKYPITNAQYAEFINQGGYRVNLWWTEIGWQLRKKMDWIEPRFWQDKNFNGEDYPIIGISWHEALAFCNWLSFMTSERISLLEESQWQRAGQATPNGENSGYIYPWGNEWDSRNCNNSVKPFYSENTTPVQKFEGHSDSPCGVTDLIGNVWEWCKTPWTNSLLVGMFGLDTKMSVSRTMRGNCYFETDMSEYRLFNRGSISSEIWAKNLGFRICRLPNNAL